MSDIIIRNGDILSELKEDINKAKVSKERNDIVEAVFFVLLDVSGSMGECIPKDEFELSVGSPSAVKIEVLKTAMNEVIKHKGDTTISLIRFSDNFEEMCPPTSDGKYINKLISNLYADGGTGMGEALRYAMRMAREFGGYRKRILLVSDGEPTDMYEEQILDMVRKESRGVIIDTIAIAFGRGEDFMRQLSEITGGVFVNLYTKEKVVEVVKLMAPENRMLESTRKALKG